MRPELRRSFDSSAPELSSEYRVGGPTPIFKALIEATHNLCPIGTISKVFFDKGKVFIYLEVSLPVFSDPGDLSTKVTLSPQAERG